MGFKIRFDIFVYNAAMGYPVNPIVPIECVESSFRSSEVMSRAKMSYFELRLQSIQ